MPSAAAGQSRKIIEPKKEDTPLPPRNPANMGRLWPTIAKTPARLCTTGTSQQHSADAHRGERPQQRSNGYGDERLRSIKKQSQEAPFASGRPHDVRRTGLPAAGRTKVSSCLQPRNYKADWHGPQDVRKSKDAEQEQDDHAVAPWRRWRLRPAGTISNKSGTP